MTLIREHYVVLLDGTKLPYRVLESAAGFYIGTELDGDPYTRESSWYWETKEEAEEALRTGDYKPRVNY